MIGEHPSCAFIPFKFVEVVFFTCLAQAILVNVSFTFEENVSSAIVVWSFYKFIRSSSSFCSSLLEIW